ncbi:MAG: hypothetical protein RIQ96_87, partial [Pseudomonadota bacterium]
MSPRKPSPAELPMALADILFAQGFGTRRQCAG